MEYLYGQTGKKWAVDLTQLDPDKADDLTDETSEDPLDDEGFADADDDPTVSVLNLDDFQGELPGQQQSSTVNAGMSTTIVVRTVSG